MNDELRAKTTGLPDKSHTSTLMASDAWGPYTRPVVDPAFKVCGLPGTPNTQRMSLVVTGDEQRTRRG